MKASHIDTAPRRAKTGESFSLGIPGALVGIDKGKTYWEGRDGRKEGEFFFKVYEGTLK